MRIPNSYEFEKELFSLSKDEKKNIIEYLKTKNSLTKEEKIILEILSLKDFFLVIF